MPRARHILQAVLVILATLLMTACATTCCQCARGRCQGCLTQPGLICTGSCGDRCFYCPIGNNCDCERQCLSPPRPAPRGGGAACKTLPKVTK